MDLVVSSVPADTPEEEALYDQTAASVLNRLRKTRNPADLLAVFRSAHKGFDRA